MWDVFVKYKAGLMVDSASPKPLVHSVQNIHLYTQQDRRTYRVIYKETNKTAHMIHEHVLSRFTKSKQPYRFITSSWVMKQNHQTIGRRTHVKETFWNMLPRYSPLHCQRETNYCTYTVSIPRCDKILFQWSWTLKGMTVARKHMAACLSEHHSQNDTAQPGPSPIFWTDSNNFMQKKLVRTVCCTISACNIKL